MRGRFKCPVAICALVVVTAVGVRGESWLRANPDAVRQYSHELADKTRPAKERLEGARALRILLTVYGAYNFSTAFKVLKTVRREPGEVGTAAAALFEDLRSASKRRDRRLPNPTVIVGPSDPAKIGIAR